MSFIDVVIRTIREGFESSIEGFLFNLSTAILILLLGFVIGKISGRAISKILHQFELNKILKSAGMKRSVEGLIGSFTGYLIYFIAIILALNQLKIASIVLYIILITIIIILIISFLLSVKDFIPNLFAGMFIYRHGLIKEGDRINVTNTTGKVVHISLIETQLETSEGDIVFIPNSILTKNKVIKISKERRKRQR